MGVNMSHQGKSSMELLCEYLKDPMGVQNEKPRFSWKVTGEFENSTQISYRICIKNSNGVVWDSKKVDSCRSNGVEFEGDPLNSRTKYSWTADIEVEQDGRVAPLQGSGCFETGILRQEEWMGCWIRPLVQYRGKAPLIRKQVYIEKLPNSARLYVCGLGYCEMTINGRKIGNSSLDPGWTDYDKTILYRVYDVGMYLKKGENILGLELGEGWLGLEHAFFEKALGKNPPWNSRPKAICNLWLDEECIYTEEDGSWLTAQGPVLENNIYDGEVYDAGAEKRRWNCPGQTIEEEDWKEAVRAQAPKGILRCQIMPEIGERFRRKPVHAAYVGEDQDYSMVLDFGQNMAGWVEVKVAGKPGSSVVMKYAEVLNDDGRVDQRNLRHAKARDIYRIGQDGEGCYHPRFTYHGFRYVQIEIEPGTLVLSAEAVQVNSRIEKAADFSCSDELVNRIYETVMKTEENNIHSVPTDCPQRDERLGWVNDMTIRYENAIYNYDMALTYEKWMQDLVDSQDVSGAIPDTAPYFFGNRPGSHITSVFVLIPWCLYSFTDDKQFLTKNYKYMKAYVNFKRKERDEAGLLPEGYFGEWAPPMTEAVWGWGENAVPRNIPQPLVTTSYLYYDCRIMEKVSRVLGIEEDAVFFHKECDKIREDINKSFYHQEGYYGTGSQGSDAMPLFLDIVPQGERDKVLNHLLHDIVQEHGYHLTTGNQMTKLIYEILMESGEEDIALELTLQTTYPSIGYMLENGATSIWERWEKLTCDHMNSHDHPMLGAFAVWFLKGLGGLKAVPDEFQKYLLCPVIPKKLQHVTFSRKLPGGTLKLSWEKNKEGMQVDIQIPWNTEAEFRVPEKYRASFGREILLRSGSYTFDLTEDT